MEEGENDDMTTVLEYTKSWLFPGTGSVDTWLNLHTGYDLSSRQCTARLGFRTENTAGAAVDYPAATASSSSVLYNYYDGNLGGGGWFTIVPIIPLDAKNERRIFVETRIRVTLPEPEFVIGADFPATSTTSGGGGESDNDDNSHNRMYLVGNGN